jgi:hypothetical protein
MNNEKFILYARRLSPSSTEHMCQVANNLQDPHYHQKEELYRAEGIIKKFTSHNHVKVVNSGNGAILSVMNAVKGPILIPNQGSWSGFKKMAELLNLKVQQINTQQGIINPDYLKKFLKNKKFKALFLTSLAGYMAEQPLEEIYQVCDDQGVLLVEDASGAIGDDKGKLACGDHAHVIVASTGSPKIVNVGNGGFISTNDIKIISSEQTILKTLKPSPLTCAGIIQEINYAPQIFSKTVKACEFLKKNIDISFHKEKRGVSVGLYLEDPKNFAEMLKTQIKVVGTNLITICPTYDRIMEPAVCLEIKNISLKDLDQKHLNKILNILTNLIEKI